MFTLHGSVAFAFVLSSWMYSDVPATNVLAPDGLRVLAAIDQPQVLRRILAGQAAWCCGASWPRSAWSISFVTGRASRTRSPPSTRPWPSGSSRFGVLAVSAWLGILFPYHPVPIRYRWSRRRQWRPMLLRWGTLVLLPYAVVPGLTVAFLAPSLLIWGLTSTSGLTQKLPDNDIGLGIGLACAIASPPPCRPARSLRLIARRRDRLVAYLSDPHARLTRPGRAAGSVPTGPTPDRLDAMATSSIAGIGDVERRELVATGPAGRTQHRRPARSPTSCLPIDLRHRPAGTSSATSGPWLRLGVAIAIFIAVLIFEIRGITRAKHPMLRAGVAMAVVIPLFLIFFAWIYLNMSGSRPGHLPRCHVPDDGAVLHRHRLLDRRVRGHHAPH